MLEIKRRVLRIESLDVVRAGIFVSACLVAQRKRVGLITQRSEDRNLAEQCSYQEIPGSNPGQD